MGSAIQILRFLFIASVSNVMCLLLIHGSMSQNKVNQANVGFFSPSLIYIGSGPRSLQWTFPPVKQSWKLESIQGWQIHSNSDELNVALRALVNILSGQQFCSLDGANTFHDFWSHTFVKSFLIILFKYIRREHWRIIHCFWKLSTKKLASLMLLCVFISYNLIIQAGGSFRNRTSWKTLMAFSQPTLNVNSHTQLFSRHLFLSRVNWRCFKVVFPWEIKPLDLFSWIILSNLNNLLIIALIN